MQNLYPIIRRVRRPLLPPEEKVSLVVPGSPVVTSAASENVALSSSGSRARADVRQPNSKGKAD